MNESVIVAGNGPSVKRIEYCRLPKEFDVFRVNNFFFEDKYYLGKKVTVYIAGGNPEQRLYDAYNLEERNEYLFGDIYTMVSNFEKYGLAEKNFSSLKKVMQKILVVPEFAHFINYHQYFFGQWPTTGVAAVCIAIALGYKKIYLVGIDFFDKREKELYCFKNTSNSENFFGKPAFNLEGNVYHNIEKIDKKLLQVAASLPSIEFFSICKDSLVNEIIPLAPILNNGINLPLPKPVDYLKNNLIYTKYS